MGKILQRTRQKNKVAAPNSMQNMCFYSSPSYKILKNAKLILGEE